MAKEGARLKELPTETVSQELNAEIDGGEQWQVRCPNATENCRKFVLISSYFTEISKINSKQLNRRSFVNLNLTSDYNPWSKDVPQPKI